ncbi:hypothetical protein DCAR_0206444 [Daucus carota subsp. sativus]|uniref:Uncharacterized protein n=1 Tax=Daucus carota subsp. sativus TaxID=79200 RepID=A0AAF0WEC3_DAUCS|nr:hypothetical protein DCAR_0206444 [Daucus carota subsp. sativus]
MAIHLYKTSTPSTRKRTVSSRVKSNPRNNLIYGQYHCRKDYHHRFDLFLWDFNTSSRYYNPMEMN